MRRDAIKVVCGVLVLALVLSVTVPRAEASGGSAGGPAGGLGALIVAGLVVYGIVKLVQAVADSSQGSTRPEAGAAVPAPAEAPETTVPFAYDSGAG